MIIRCNKLNYFLWYLISTMILLKRTLGVASLCFIFLTRILRNAIFYDPYMIKEVWINGTIVPRAFEYLLHCYLFFRDSLRQPHFKDCPTRQANDVTILLQKCFTWQHGNRNIPFKHFFGICRIVHSHDIYYVVIWFIFTSLLGVINFFPLKKCDVLRNAQCFNISIMEWASNYQTFDNTM